jgi:hypothetical protein
MAEVAKDIGGAKVNRKNVKERFTFRLGKGNKRNELWFNLEKRHFLVVNYISSNLVNSVFTLALSNSLILTFNFLPWPCAHLPCLYSDLT